MKSSSGWTIETLLAHFTALRDADSKAISAALVSAEKAVQVAEANAEKWRANANEWRGAMSDREKTFATKAEFQVYRDATDKALDVEKERSDIGQGKGMGISQGWSLLLGAVGLIGGLIAIFFSFTR